MSACSLLSRKQKKSKGRSSVQQKAPRGPCVKARLSFPITLQAVWALVSVSLLDCSEGHLNFNMIHLVFVVFKNSASEQSPTAIFQGNSDCGAGQSMTVTRASRL